MDSTKILYQKGDVKYSTDYFEKRLFLLVLSQIFYSDGFSFALG